MSEPFLGELRIFAGNFAPVNWAFCNGQPLSIAENDALYQLLGTTYGGDGVETFNLPSLAGRAPMHVSASQPLGMSAGAEQVALTIPTLPAHGHPAPTANTSHVNAPTGAVLADASSGQAGVRIYSNQAPNTTLHPASVTMIGGGAAHDNMQPSVALNFIICLAGIYPPQS